MSIFSKFINKHPVGITKVLAWIFTAIIFCLIVVAAFIISSFCIYYVGNFILSAFYFPEMTFGQAVAITFLLMLLRSTLKGKD